MMRSRTSLRSRSGLTLVELLVAIGLTMFILVIFSTLLVGATEGISRSKGMMVVDQKVRAAAATLRKDLKDVYIANGANQLSPAELFTSPVAIPTQGYFMIEENDRALQQGVDAAGLPIEIDYDDVLAMTVRRAGTSPEEIFYGYVGHDTQAPGDALSGNGFVVDFGEYLDNIHGVPVARFDDSGNNLYTSRYAEVIYFLRPVGKQHKPADLGASPYQFTSPTHPQHVPPPVSPATFNLYRRVLLVVEDSAQIPPAADGGVGFPLPNNDSIYNRYDLSMRRVIADVGGVPQPLPRFQVNTLQDLARREYRYGMHLLTGLHNPGVPTVNGIPFVRAVPMSHFPLNMKTGAISVNETTIFLHDYYRAVIPTFFTSNSLPDPPEPWFGRPTLAESATPFFQNQCFFQPNPGSPIPLGGGINFAPTTDGSVPPDPTNPPNGILDFRDAYDLQVAQGLAPRTRINEDLLLTNVVSFDIKVFEELSEVPWAARAGNPVGGHDFSQSIAAAIFGTDPFAAIVGDPYNAPPLQPVPISEYRGGWVDLGYGSDLLFRAGTAGNVSTVLERQSYYPTGADLLALDTDNRIPLNRRFLGGWDPRYAPFGLPISREAFDPDVADNSIRFGPDRAPGEVNVDDDSNSITDDVGEYLSTNPFGDDWSEQRFNNWLRQQSAVPYGQYFPVYVGGDGAPGVVTVDDDGNAQQDDLPELFWPGSDDASGKWFSAFPYLLGGQVAHHNDNNWNPLDSNPRNTYDSWCAPTADGSRPAWETYHNDPYDIHFRPVPYPRPLKAIKITIRVLDPASGTVREFPIVHAFR